MPKRLDGLEDDKVLSLAEVATLLSLEQTKIEYFAQTMNYGLKSKLLRGKRYFYVRDLRYYLENRLASISISE
jgi:hypothetical protein